MHGMSLSEFFGVNRYFRNELNLLFYSSVLKPSDKAATGDSSAENSTNAPIRRQNSGSSAASNGSKSSQNSSVFSLSTDLERHAENVVKNLGEFQVRASQNAM